MSEIENYLQEIFKIQNPVIPLKIFLYWHDPILPPKMQESVELLKKNNPEFKVFLFDDQKTRDYLKNQFHPIILEAYDNLIRISDKSDLFRYCIIYKEGGIYLDIKFQPINNFKLICLAKYDEVWCHEGIFDEESISSNCIVYTGIIISKSKNPHLKIAIDNILENVKFKIKGNICSYPTGPYNLSRCFNFDVMKSEKFKLRFEWRGAISPSDNNTIFITKNNDEKLIPIFECYKGYRDEQKIFGTQPHWSELWDQNKIYH